jgi:hypothetical protein
MFLFFFSPFFGAEHQQEKNAHPPQAAVHPPPASSFVAGRLKIMTSVDASSLSLLED